MSQPDPPVNVRLLMTDGTVVPVDTLYQGIHDGNHHWAVVNPPPPGLVKGMKIDELPPQTAVTLSAGTREG